MKTIIVLIALAFTSIVDDINNDPTSTWVAVEYEPEVMEMRRKSLMAPFKVDLALTLDAPNKAVPDSFDSRDQWGTLILPVRDQSNCGSCWAFAVAETTGDRLGIVNSKSQGVFSPQDLVSCDTKDAGCDGGDMSPSWSYVTKTGLALDSCIPYTSGSGRVAKCPTTCTNGSGTIVRTKAKSAAAVSASKMQTELYTNGPFEVGFNVYSDFDNYKSGVYQHKSGSLEGGHAVLVVGWGTESSTPYWLVQNSWGTSWGISGFFKILRGKNECGIEQYSWAGQF